MRKWGAWIILLKGLTPIPYKIVTITSGFAGYNIWLFILFSIIARGMRFYLEAFLLNRYGEQARVIIEKRLGIWVTVVCGGTHRRDCRRGLSVLAFLSSGHGANDRDRWKKRRAR